MATQRITLEKIRGVAADVVVRRLRMWSGERQTTDANLWSPEQWPSRVRNQADAFAEQLRANALSPPVMHFVEWSDFWSMGDLFLWAFTPPGGPAPMVVHGDRFELYAYSLPDDGRLARHLSLGAPQGFPEANWFTARLREAIEACDQLVERAVLVVLRHVVGGSVLDEDISASLDRLPDWLARDEE